MKPLTILKWVLILAGVGVVIYFGSRVKSFASTLWSYTLGIFFTSDNEHQIPPTTDAIPGLPEAKEAIKENYPDIVSWIWKYFPHPFS